MEKKHTLILMLLLISNLILTDSKAFGMEYTESSNGELKYASTDTALVRLLNDIAYDFFWEFEFDSCFFYASQALEISEILLNLPETNKNRAYLNVCKVLKGKSLANLGRAIKTTNTNAALDTLYSGLKLIKEAGNKFEEGRIYESLGVIYDFLSKDQLALESHLLSLEAYREAEAKSHTALQLTNVAVAYRNMGKYGDALEYLVESLNLSRKLNDSSGMVEALLAIGFTYMYVEKWEDAIAVQEEALTIYQSLGDSLGIARIYNDMGATNMMAGNLETALEQHKAALAIRLNSTEYYYTYASYVYIGDIYMDLALYEDAIVNYMSGLEYARISGTQLSVVYSHLSVGKAYYENGNYEMAMEQYTIALQESAKIEDRTSEAMASMNIADIYLEWDQAEEALLWLQKAEKAAPKSSNIFLKRIYERIAESYNKLGDYKNAYRNALIYSNMKDSAIAAENLEKITTLTNRLEFENKKKLQDESHKKMMELKQSEVNRQKVVRNFSLFGTFVVLVLAIIFFIRFIEKNKLSTKLKVTLQNLRAAQSQLVHSEKMASLGELTAGVAHEIQNPLNFIKNFSEVNADMIQELNEEVRQGNMDEVVAIANDIASNEDKIIEHSKRADSIVKGMLQHSRTGNNEKRPTNLNAIADEYIRLAYHGFRAKDKSFNAYIKTELDENMPDVNVVGQDIARVVLNLINNAFQAVSAAAIKALENEEKDYKPEVIISTKKLDKAVEIIVKDNGGGIPKEIQDKIFQPFFTTKPSGEGTGLGLSLSYDIITKGHDGELMLETEIGNGSTFIIRIPLK